MSILPSVNLPNDIWFAIYMNNISLYYKLIPEGSDDQEAPFLRKLSSPLPLRDYWSWICVPCIVSSVEYKSDYI